MIEGWENKLNLYLTEIQKKSFEWGVCDCLIFASDICVIKSGKDPMSRKRRSDPKTIRKKYTTERQAKDLIKKYRRSVPDIMDCHFARVLPVKAQRGDIVYWKGVFGVSAGQGQAFFKLDRAGLVKIKLRDCKIAWRVE